ncbi:Dot/Icm T4SS effector AnkD/LegA15 [Legionella dresdenensis]|uniref:Dot/Icm T4SS effector AnkD/LegA15 n=1 Tax=Legionella dresdenensis TaxID=450200 RepID=A0ABV8CEH0_9GAMM
MPFFQHEQSSTDLASYLYSKIMSAEKTASVAIEHITAQQQRLFNFLTRLFRKKQTDQDTLKQQLMEAALAFGLQQIQEALNIARNQHGHSLLTQALLNQDFELADQLTKLGATAGPIEKAAFELALDSDAAKRTGFTATQKPTLHPVKHFGLSLGIVMTSKDGTFSQFGHIGPTYQMMADAVGAYAKNSANADFQQIAEAFDFANQAAKFSNSTALGIPEAGEALVSRVQEGKITTIPISVAGHAMGLSIIPDGAESKTGYLVLTDRGITKKSGEEGTQIFRVDLDKINSTFINTVLNGHAKGIPYATVISEVRKITDEKPPIQTIRQKNQKCDNCTIANTRSNIHGIQLCQKAIACGGFDKLGKQDLETTHVEYKKFTNQMRVSKVHELVKAHQQNPTDPDLTNLAHEYLRKHPSADVNIRGPLEKMLGTYMRQESEPSSANSISKGM